jgi:hypothetical protein
MGGSVPCGPAPEFPTFASSGLRECPRKMVNDITGISLPQNDSDMFEIGLDSLQASRVRCAILDQLRRGRKEGGSVKLEKDLCFAFPSVDRMAGLCHFS